MSVEQLHWPASDDHDEQLEELVAAQALGSIEPADVERLQRHLPRCERCRRLLVQYGAVVDTLPLALEPAAPNPDLKSRLMAAVHDDVARDAGESGGPTVPGTGPVQPPPAPSEDRSRDGRSPDRPGPTRLPGASRPRNRRLAWALPLAAMVLLSIGLGWWNQTLRTELQVQRVQLEQQHRVIAAIATGGQQVALAGTEHAPAASGEVLQPPDGGRPLLLAQGLPNLAPSQVYQVWIISNGQPVGVGLLTPSNGAAAMVALDRHLAGAEVVALTVEPPGGSPAPTGPIVLAGKV